MLRAASSIPTYSGFEIDAADLADKLQGPGGVLDDLDGLDVGDVVEEPAVAREDQHRVPLELEELEDRRLVLLGEPAPDVPDEEGLDRLGRPVEDDPDVVVPDGPRVRRVGAQARLEDRRGLVAQPVHRFPERGPPGLAPTGVGAGRAGAIALPALDAVAAAPGRVLDDPDLVGRREPLEVVPVDGDLREPVLLDVAEGVGQGHLAEAVMVPVGLAVGGDVDELGTAGLRRESGDEPLRESLAVPEEVAEGEIVGDRAVVEEEGDRPARRQPAEVGLSRVDPALARVPPLPAREGPRRRGLARRQDGEQDAFGGHDVERLEVDRRLGQPHPLGPAAEAGFEVPDAPEDLGPLVAARGQGHDDVVVGLGHGGAVAAEPVPGRPVGLENGPRRLPGSPSRARRGASGPTSKRSRRSC